MVALALTLVALGTALATRGLIGRRVGDEPRMNRTGRASLGVASATAGARPYASRSHSFCRSTSTSRQPLPRLNLDLATLSVLLQC